MGSNEWLAGGGAYLLLGIMWIGSALVFAVIGLQTGKRTGSANDGCLMAIGNVVMAILGGALGYMPFMAYFPTFVVTSMVGALLLPALSTQYFYRAAKRR